MRECKSICASVSVCLRRDGGGGWGVLKGSAEERDRYSGPGFEGVFPLLETQSACRDEYYVFFVLDSVLFIYFFATFAFCSLKYVTEKR